VFAYVAPIPRSSLQILKGTTKGYKQPKSENLSRKQVTRHFCGDCGTPLWAESGAAPEGCFIKLALFGNKLPPGAEVLNSWQKPIVAPEAVFDVLPA